MKQFIFLMLGCLLLTAFLTDYNEPLVSLKMKRALMYNGCVHEITIKAHGIENKD